MVRWRELAAFVAVVVVATFLNLHAQGQSLDTTYENALRGCQRNNPVREAVVLATETAAELARGGQGRYAIAASKLKEQAFANPDGSVNCREAIEHP